MEREMPSEQPMEEPKSTKEYGGESNMKESVYKSYDELPLFLNAKMVAEVLGVSAATGYELMHEEGFPVVRVGNRMVVPKDKFRDWVERQADGGS